MTSAFGSRGIAACLSLALLGSATAARADDPSGAPLDPQRVLSAVIEHSRAHQAPAFVAYTLRRWQLTVAGAPDFANVYTTRYWVRTADRAALTRRVFLGAERGPLTFDRPAFNEARDPGPPTVDFFDGADAETYVADSATVEGTVVHVRMHPAASPDRNRLREIFADKDTYALRELVAIDTLFVRSDSGGVASVYPVTLTITMSDVNGVPAVRNLHGVVGGDYHGDGKEVEFEFTDITFPVSVPDWYFDPQQYGRHAADAPA
jgi:hypothetical protein